MSLALALLHISAICLVSAVLFTAVEWFEPNRRLVIIFKCALPAAGVAAVATQLLPHGLGQKAKGP
jgi:hypothetical protein